MSTVTIASSVNDEESCPVSGNTLIGKVEPLVESPVAVVDAKVVVVVVVTGTVVVVVVAWIVTTVDP